MAAALWINTFSFKKAKNEGTPGDFSANFCLKIMEFSIQDS